MMNDDEAIGPLEATVCGLFSQLGRDRGGSVVDTETRLIVRSPIHQAPYNGVYRFRDDGRPMTEQVAEILDGFDPHVAVTWLVHPTSPPEVTEALTAHGLVQVEVMRGMVADLDEVSPTDDAPSGFRIEEADPDDSTAWVHLIRWRYSLDPDASDYLDEIYRIARANGTRLWVAYDGDEPVSKSATFVAGGAVGVFGVATTEAGRGKGLAHHLTMLGLRAAVADGVTTAVLHSTPMAHSLYRRMGFRDVAPFGLWATPGRLEV